MERKGEWRVWENGGNSRTGKKEDGDNRMVKREAVEDRRV